MTAASAAPATTATTPRAKFDPALLLVVPAAAFMLLVFVYPFLNGLVDSFNPKEGGWLANYSHFFTTDNLWPTIWTTLKLALPATIINVGFAMPTFWLGIMLIFLFSGPGLNILPASGMTDTRASPAFGSDPYWVYFGGHPIAAILDIGRHLIRPVFTLVVVNIAGDSRFVRASMLEALSQDYVRTAKAKGLPGRSVTFKHALRNALLPVVTNIGLEIPFLFTGAIVTETIFSWPGIGKLTIDSTRAFDYPTLMGLLLITSVLVVLANLIADVTYAFVDPRIKF